jgi:hypothetical protein
MITAPVIFRIGRDHCTGSVIKWKADACQHYTNMVKEKAGKSVKALLP